MEHKLKALLQVFININLNPPYRGKTETVKKREMQKKSDTWILQRLQTITDISKERQLIVYHLNVIKYFNSFHVKIFDSLNTTSTHQNTNWNKRITIFCNNSYFVSYMCNSEDITLRSSFNAIVYYLIAYINTTSRGVVYMKSYPSEKILNDPIKHNMINQLLSESKIDLNSYMLILSNSMIKDKHVLTNIGMEMLILPEHKLLYENLKKKYPNRNLDRMCSTKIFNIILTITILIYIYTIVLLI